MSTHAAHPLVIQHGLADGCDRCAEIAADPIANLDSANLKDLLVRTRMFQKDGISPRSGNEWVAIRQMEIALNRARIIAELEAEEADDMGIRISDPTHVILYDSVTGVAFGPVFADSWEADEFLRWLTENEWPDARKLAPQTLMILYAKFSGERGGEAS